MYMIVLIRKDSNQRWRTLSSHSQKAAATPGDSAAGPERGVAGGPPALCSAGLSPSDVFVPLVSALYKSCLTTSLLMFLNNCNK